MRLGNATCSPAQELRLRPGDCFTVAFPHDWPPHLQPRQMDLVILYEDDCMLVLDKPAGIVVHPARGHMRSATLQNGVLFRYRDRLTDPLATIGPAHRLDRDTSGVIVFSRTRPAYQDLTRQFSAHRVRKEYIALVSGEPGFDEIVVDAPLGVDPRNPRCGAVVPLPDGGRPALTRLRVIERGRGWALVGARPMTGRPHQVRLHLAHKGLPVIGDRYYHPDPEAGGAGRQMLHAASLEISHPLTRKPMRFVACMPDDMRKVVYGLRCGSSAKPGLSDDTNAVDGGRACGSL